MSSLRGDRTAVIFPILAINACAFAMLQSLLVPALPIIQHDLHTTSEAVTWSLTAWLITAAVATPILGKVGDMIGKRKTMVIALLAIAIGSLISLVAENVGMLIAGRVVQGLGAAIFPLSYGIARDEFPVAKMPSIIGSLSAIIGIGSGLGMILAGPIEDVLGWRGLFSIPMVLFFVSAAASFFLIPESRSRAGGRINWVAATLFTGWLVALLLPVSSGSRWGWTSLPILGLFAAAAALFAAWMIVEFKTRHPVIDMQLMRLPGIWTTNFAGLLFGAAMYGIFVFLPQMAQLPASTGFGFGASVSGSGLIMVPMLAAMAVAGFVSGPLSRRISLKLQLTAAAASVSISSLALALFHATPIHAAAAAGIAGIGLGLGIAAMASLVIQSAPTSQVSVASGMSTNLRTIGGAIGSAIMGAIVTGHPGADGLPAESGFVIGFLAMGAFAGMAVAFSLLVPGKRRQAALAEIAAAAE